MRKGGRGERSYNYIDIYGFIGNDIWNFQEERMFNISGSANSTSFDDEFAASATPVFIVMLSLSVSMFIAAFFQVNLSPGFLPR